MSIRPTSRICRRDAPFRGHHSRCPFYAMPLPLATLPATRTRQREQESGYGCIHHSFLPFQTLSYSSLFYNFEASERASQPERTDILAYLPTVGTGFVLQRGHPSIIGHSESLSWLLDTNSAIVPPRFFFFFYYSRQLLREADRRMRLVA